MIWRTFCDLPWQVRLNHVGDWGTQFGMLISHLKEVAPEAIEDGAEEKVHKRFVLLAQANVKQLLSTSLPRGFIPQSQVKRARHHGTVRLVT